MVDREARKRFADVVREYNNRKRRPAQPHCELLRDGRDIAGEWCRLSMGGIVLCEAAGNPIFTPNTGKDPTSVDVLEAYWLWQDRNLDEAVWLVQDPPALRRTIGKYAAGLSWKNMEQINAAIASWLGEILKALPNVPDSGDLGDDRRGDWYIEIVDVLAHEYRWGDEFIMWRLPWVRNVRLCEAACARRSGKPIVEDRSEELDALMQTLLEAVGKDG